MCNACKTSKSGMCMHCCTQFNSSMYMWTSEFEHMQHMRDACYKFALGLPHYKCGVTTGTVT